MSKHQETKAEYIYRVVIPKATSLGAAIVVIGALFKIMHWPGAGLMLTVGLLTESLIFAIGVFQPAPPPEQHYDWAKVYPELSGAQAGNRKPNTNSQEKGVAVLGGIDKMLSEANLSSDSFKQFGAGMKQLNDTANKLKDITNVSAASDEYARTLQVATKSMGDLNKAYSGTVSAMNQMASTSKDAKEYHAQVQVITKNLGALNAVYEMELKDANSHLKAMNKFYSNLTVAMESMSDASKESQAFKQQMSQLTSNLTSLNKVYGNMLTAMKG
ncbi:gliding motility protein GldL [Rapidithrix thailandica]|uniref:Gliding motility protein GldL n=1 Tax=Rapidithrix thailandica TaxID=413964 RepID=A0AAW9RQ66_9BACT